MKRIVDGKIMEDKRKFYVFKTFDGLLVETKAVSEEDALLHIKKHIKLKEVA